MERFENEVISFDQDSTLSNSVHRHYLIDRNKDNGPDFWDMYSLQGEFDGDGPALPLAQFLSRMHIPWIVVSGRSEIARAVTMEWYRKRGLTPAHVFLCDERHNYMGHGEWKATRLLEVQEQIGKKIALHFDDILDVAVATEKVGIRTVLVHDIASNFGGTLG